MVSAPCAKFTMRVTPKISDRPAATRNSVEALASPLRSWATIEDMPKISRRASSRPSRARLFRGAKLSDFRVGRQEPRSVRIRPRGHDALAVLPGGAADVSPHGRLMVELAEDDVAERRVHLEALHRRDQLLAVQAPRSPDRRRGGHHHRVAHDRSGARVIVPA